MRQQTLWIIDKYRLYPMQIARMADLERCVVVNYLEGGTNYGGADDRIEESVRDWYTSLIAKRHNLLKTTRYAHVYANVN